MCIRDSAKAVDRVRARIGRDQGEALARSIAVLAARQLVAPVEYLERIAARGVGRTTVLEVADIRWIEAADNYVRLHTAEGVHLSRRTMRDLEALLDPKRFARIHRSAIVALRLVRELRPLGAGHQELLLEGGEVAYEAISSPGYPTVKTNVLHGTTWNSDNAGPLVVRAGMASASAANPIRAVASLTQSRAARARTLER